MLALVATSLFIFADVSPTVTYLQPECDVWDVITSDLNADGLEDIVILGSDSRTLPTQKLLVAFVARSDGSFAKTPSAMLELEDSAGTGFTAEVDGEAPREVVIADQRGATVYRLLESSFLFVRHSEFASLFPSGANEPVFLPDSAIDLDGDDIDEWLVPVAGGYEIRNADGLRASISAPTQSEIIELGTLAIQHRLPTARAFSLGESPTKGIALLSDRAADFSYGAGWSEHLRYRIPARLDERWEAYARMDDVNGDDFPDLLVTQTEGVTNMTTETQLYVADVPFEYPDSPTAIFTSKGSFTTPGLYDIDRDGDADVVLTSIPLSLRNIVNFFLRGKVSLQLDVYLSQSGRFGTKPTHRKSVTMVAPEGRERVVYAMGDFNGDDRLDVAMGTAANQVGIYAGDAESFLSSKPWKTLKVPAFGIGRVVDLDANGTEDLVVFHRNGPEQRRIEVIQF